MAKTRWIYTNKALFKALLIVIALVLIVAEVWYTQRIVVRLRQDQREIVELNVGFYQKVAETGGFEDVSFFFDNIIQEINVPVIVSTTDGIPSGYKNIPSLHDSAQTPGVVAQLKDIMYEMDRENPPIDITFNDSIVVSRIHYGDSQLIKWLNWLPAVQVVMVGMFILVGFIGFNNIRRSEQRFIWIGMAKETAHQLGTPISSLYGWLELLKQEQGIDEEKQQIYEEMSRDTVRLSKIAQRFSQIGSVTEYSKIELSGLLAEIAAYFRRRLPQSGKAVRIEEDFRTTAVCRVNTDLFEWTIENLIKNGLDAIENSNGKIILALHREGDWIVVDVTDNGKGMSKKQQKNIFKPGYSTKKRGWGLGLNLAKRIIEEHHDGRLAVKQSRLHEGTTMRVMLRESSG